MQSGEVTCLGSEQDQSLTSVPLLWDLHSHLSDTLHQPCPAPRPFHQLDLDLGGWAEAPLEKWWRHRG